MKKLLFILILISALSAIINAQQGFVDFDNDTISADTNTYSLGQKVKTTLGVIGFEFYKVDVTDSLSICRLEGSMDGDEWTALTGTATLAATTTDGRTLLYTSTLYYLYYRAFLACASGDEVAITYPYFIYKEE